MRTASGGIPTSATKVEKTAATLFLASSVVFQWHLCGGVLLPALCLNKYGVLHPVLNVST